MNNNHIQDYNITTEPNTQYPGWTTVKLTGTVEAYKGGSGGQTTAHWYGISFKAKSDI